MESEYQYEDFVNAANVIRKQISVIPEIGIVLGSGLGNLAEEVENPVMIDYHDIPGWPVSTVEGHKGRLVIGTWEGKSVFVQQGRVHFYEGYTPSQVTFAVRVMECLEIKKLILTNAAGGVNKDYQAGDVMLITDHIGFPSMTGVHPLIGPNYDEFGERFPDLSHAYDAEFCRLAQEAAKKLKINLHEGVYTWLSGPSYETAAEVRFLRMIGTDAVGMSTVPEVIAARHAGMRVLGFPGITNQSCDVSEQEVSHEQVLAAADQIGEKIIAILREILPQM